MLNSITPFFIVDDLSATIAFYQSKLGFNVRYKGGGDGNIDDYWVFMGRDQVMLNFKAITPEVHPQPNHSRHEWARWDAYIYTDDPDALYKSSPAGRFPCIASSPIPAMDSGPSRSSTTTDTCRALGGR